MLNAFNDNLYKNAMVLFVVYQVYNSTTEEEARFSAIASAVFIIPFFLLSALAGQLGRHARQGADHPLGETLRGGHHAGGRDRSGDGVEAASSPRSPLSR